MKKKYLALAGRIRGELSELRQVVGRVQAGWERASPCYFQVTVRRLVLGLNLGG
ncbi:MAG: hypothetical protein PWP65_2138 [Clostridia bacterium]|nr:hypothetical protein [Clostridia bacterium]